jgi:glycosyltransferase involved in cell wall biosynthesis
VNPPVPLPHDAKTPPSDVLKFSIITPSLNQGRFLGTCLGSVFSQDHPAIEVIVVDGGSSDETLAVVREHEHRLAWWVSEPDRGQSDAINKGLARATGDLVSWLNADDYLLPGALAAVADAHAANPRAPFYYGNGLRVDERGVEQSRFFARATPAFDRQALVLGLNYVLQPATFIERSAWQRVGGLDVALRWGMDTDLWLRLSALGEPVAVDRPLAASREYAATKTASGLFERVEELRTIAARHSGAEITPGVLCYFADTLHRYSRSRSDLFGSTYARDVVEPFWAATAELMRRFGAGPDGMPLRSASKRSER